MDYSNHCCPVCEKPFTPDSEVVVCPECGTPHHRECYDNLNHCFYEERHKDGFDFRAESSAHTTNSNQNNKENKDNKKHNNYNNHANSSGSDIIACKNCGTFNVASNDVCNNCGAPLEKNSTQNPYNTNRGYNTTQPGTGPAPGQPFPGFAFDPMGGLDPDTQLDENVTVSDVSKFTKNNSPFFCRLFHQIKTSNRSRFSFVGFIFHGGWLLYRKMYVLGTIITALMAAMIVTQLFIPTFYPDLIKDFTEVVNTTSYAEMFSKITEFYNSRDAEGQIVMLVYAGVSIGQTLLRIICALCANRWYYKHTLKTISKIKSKPEIKENADSALQAKGGVNGALAISLMITYAVLSFIPNFF